MDGFVTHVGSPGTSNDEQKAAQNVELSETRH